MIKVIFRIFFFFYGLLLGRYSTESVKRRGYRPVEEEKMTLFEALDRSLALGYNSVEWGASW